MAVSLRINLADSKTRRSVSKMKVVPDASLKRLPKAGTMILDPSLSSLSF